MNAFQVRQPTVQLTVGGVHIPVSEVTLTHQVNQLPEISFKAQLDNGGYMSGGQSYGNTEINLDMYGRLNTVMQNRVLNQFVIKPDTKLILTDGTESSDDPVENHRLEFYGLLQRPGFGLSNNNVSLSLMAASSAINLQCFNPSIYSLPGAIMVEPMSSLFKDGTFIKFGETHPIYSMGLNDVWQPQPYSDSIADWVAVILFGAMRNYPEENIAKALRYSPSPVQMHNLNKLIWPYVREVLQRSSAYTWITNLSHFAIENQPISVSEPTMGLRPGETPVTNWTLLQHLREILMRAESFYDVFPSLLESFYFQLNADWAGKLRIEHLMTLAKTEGRVIRAAYGDVSFSLSNPYSPPLRQVVMLGPMQPAFTGDGSSTFAPTPLNQNSVAQASLDAYTNGYFGLNVVTAYPAQISDAVVGTSYLMHAPDWLGQNLVRLIDARYAMANLAQPFLDTPPGRMNGVTQAVLQASAMLKQDNHHRISLLDYYAARQFSEWYLKDAEALVTLPLSLNKNLVLGRTYEVRTLDDHLLFTGYLRMVQHMVNTNQEHSQATTVLSFSHVLAPNTQLSHRGEVFAKLP